jgi:CheY-like chemotaxis protein
MESKRFMTQTERDYGERQSRATLKKRKTWRPDGSHGPVESLHATERTMKSEGKIELRRKPVALDAILKASERSARSICAVNRQKLVIKLPAEPIYLDADAARLEQVFGNLLGNACQYAGEGAHITVGAERDPVAEPPQIVVRVHDDGVGIDSELLRRIFDPSIRANPSPDPAPGDLSRGLVFVQQLVQMHGGIIEAVSEGPGRGAQFIVRLPMMDADFLTPAPSPPKRGDTPRRILIVDDNTDSTHSMEALQVRHGHEVRTAASGPEALAIAAEFLPQVVLLDIRLPGMDGFEVARQLRSMLALRHVFLIAMTGYASPEDRQLAHEAGFDEHLIKPVDLKVLRAWLEDENRFVR